MSISSFSTSNAPGIILLRTLHDEMNAEIAEALTALEADAPQACVTKILVAAEQRRLMRLEAFVRQVREDSPPKLNPKPKKQSLLLPATASLYHALRKRNSSQLAGDSQTADHLQRLQKAFTALQLQAEDTDPDTCSSSSSASELAIEDTLPNDIALQPLDALDAGAGVQESIALVMMRAMQWEANADWPVDPISNIWPLCPPAPAARHVPWSSSQILVRQGRLDKNSVFYPASGVPLLLQQSGADLPFPPSRLHLSATEGVLRVGQEGEEQALLLRHTKAGAVIQLQPVLKPRARDDVLVLDFQEDSFAAQVAQGPFGAFARVPLPIETGLRLEASHVLRFGPRCGLAIVSTAETADGQVRRALLGKALLHLHCFDEGATHSDLALAFAQHKGPFIVIELLRLYRRYCLSRIRQRWILFGSSPGRAAPPRLPLPPGMHLSLVRWGEFAFHRGPAPPAALSARSLMRREEPVEGALWLGLECLHDARLPWGTELLLGDWRLRVDCRQCRVACAP